MLVLCGPACLVFSAAAFPIFSYPVRVDGSRMRVIEEGVLKIKGPWLEQWNRRGEVKDGLESGETGVEGRQERLSSAVKTSAAGRATDWAGSLASAAITSLHRLVKIPHREGCSAHLHCAIRVLPSVQKHSTGLLFLYRFQSTIVKIGMSGFPQPYKKQNFLVLLV